jgi:quercetin dioxygenase-like cupin family protein
MNIVSFNYSFMPEAPIAGIPTLEQIYAVERELAELPQSDFSLINRFADGLYARQVTIRRDCFLTSKIHLKEHFAFILTGDITVWTDQDCQRFRAPCVLTTKPGTKRVLLAHEETVWITVHATNAKTVEEAEAELVSNDPAKLYEARHLCPSG